jgi:hypothetical protein
MNHQKLLQALHKRFITHMHRHPGITWDDVEERLSVSKVMNAVLSMEETGGEPDVVVLDSVLYVVDMAKESPSGRRSCCYDEAARFKRKKFPPQTSAEQIAATMKTKIVNELMYQQLQAIERLDTKTSSWLLTPPSVRNLGGGLFGDCRFERVFIYSNGADSYYADRGVRTYITLPKGDK